MKLVFLNLYSGRVVRGAETFSEELAQRLKKKHQVIYLKGNSNQQPSHQFSGNQFQRWFNRKRWFIDAAGLEVLKFTLRNLRQIIAEKPDWVIPLNGFWQMLLLKLVQPWVGFEILVTGHSGPGWDERWNVYLHPTVFVATTQPAREWAESTCSWTQVELIPYGIEVEKFSSARASHIDLPKPIILCPAALVPYKRIDLAIQAVAELKQASLLVVGRGELKSELEVLGKDLLGDRFQLLSVPYNQMPKIFAAADIVTLPSSPQENSPMVCIESLAAGKAMVTTDAPRNRWILEEAGFYVDPVDIKGYAEVLQKALRKKVDTRQPLAKFQWQTVLALYDSLFTQTYR